MDFVFVGGIVLLVLLGPWVLVWRISSRRKRERDEDNERWQELTSRTYTLEQTVRTLQAQRHSKDIRAPWFDFVCVNIYLAKCRSTTCSTGR